MIVRKVKPQTVDDRKTALLVTSLASLTFLAVGMNLLSYGAVQESVIPELSLSLTESGFLVSAFFISYASMQVPGGYLADRWGGEKTIAVFVSIVGLAAVGFSQINTFPAALLFRMMLGFGSGALLPSAVRTLSRRLEGRQLDLANGIFGAGFGASQLVIFNVLPVTTIDLGWRPSLLLIAVLTLGVAAYAWILALSLKPAPSQPSETLQIRKRQLFTRNLTLLFIINATGISLYVATLTWAPLQLQNSFGITAIQAGQIVSVMGVVTIISSIMGAAATRKMGKRRVVISSMGISTAMVIFLTNPVNPAIAFLIIAVLGFGAMFYLPPVFSLVPASSPVGRSHPGLLFGVFNTFSNAIAFFPPLLMGLVLDTTQSFTFAFLVLATMSGIGLLSAFLLKSPRVPHA